MSRNEIAPRHGSVITFNAPPPANAPAVDLDKDPVGDLLSGTYTVMMTIPGIMCDDTDGDGFLNVPNCTTFGRSSTR